MAIAAAAAAFEASALGEWIRGAGQAYAVANVVHLLGLSLLVGPALLMDLRLLGLGRAFPLAETVRCLGRVAGAGLVLAVCSGVALFSADAVALSTHPLMRLKLALVLLALANVALFHAWAGRERASWTATVPVAARACAVVSLLAWPAIVVAGRMIAYV
ncbi:hypothetical protein QFW80_03475 [Luteimonas sp. M1R5S18]|uniref:DUF2214 domain-containing protein n=1 Tax=Luteimonas rhizosphaericola TaxID=3042024 RepID=A0ABT6JFY3_9GAMM|nr:hypothetical protein [Luteimonas rhizosphaericola]MDH5829580.1 hypothetical protein [Luteimonas rhizosphaericola]